MIVDNVRYTVFVYMQRFMYRAAPRSAGYPAGDGCFLKIFTAFILQ